MEPTGFFSFWAEAARNALSSAWGVVGAADLIVSLVGILAYDWLKKRVWSKRILDLPVFSEKWRFIVVFLGWFVLGTLFLAPYWQYKHIREVKLALEKANASLQSDNKSLTTKFSDYQKADDEAKIVKPLKELTAAQKQTAAALAEHKRIFIDTQRSNNPATAALKQMASAQVDMPTIEGKSGIDLEGVAAAEAKLRDVRNKSEAQEALSRAEGMPLEEELHAIAFPILDYYIKDFHEALRKLAAQYGDAVISTYTNPPTTFRGQFNEPSIIRMEKNSQWNFAVYLRKDSQAFGQLTWAIMVGPFVFGCYFNGNDYNYRIEGAPQAAPGMSGSGKVKSLTVTNLTPALTWLIGLQKEAQPLTNVAQTVSK